MGRADLAGAAHLELVSGVVQLRPQDAMVEAMLRGWRAQQAARGLAGGHGRRPGSGWCAGSWSSPTSTRGGGRPAHVDEWSLWLTSEKHLAPSTIRGYQGELRLFSEFLIDARYGWVVACEEAFGTHPVPICHEWNTIAHLNDYEGRPEARPFTREEMQRFLDYADDQVERAVRAKRKGALAAYRDATLFKVDLRVGAAADGDGEAGRGRLRPEPEGAAVRAATACSTSATARRRGASRRGAGTCCR